MTPNLIGGLISFLTVSETLQPQFTIRICFPLHEPHLTRLLKSWCGHNVNQNCPNCSAGV